MIIGARTFVELAGNDTHELPPLFLAAASTPGSATGLFDTASVIIDQEEMVEAAPLGVPMLRVDHQRRQTDLALNLVARYRDLQYQWNWGDSILQWIRQCETTFGTRQALRPLLRSDVWPHAGRASFVTLLEDKEVDHTGVDLECAVGLRLSFRQMPPIRCCSDQFLLYLNSTVGNSAYHTWSDMASDHVSLPPERFSFQVVKSDLEMYDYVAHG